MYQKKQAKLCTDDTNANGDPRVINLVSKYGDGAKCSSGWKICCCDDDSANSVSWCETNEVNDCGITATNPVWYDDCLNWCP